MKFKPESQWVVGRTIIKGRSSGGQITYKGKAPRLEEDKAGQPVERMRGKFQLRVGKRTPEPFVGTADEARASIARFELGDPKNGPRSIHLTEDALHAVELQRKFVLGLLSAGKITEEQAEYIFPSRGGPRPYANPANMAHRWKFHVLGSRLETPPPPRELGGRPRRQPLQGVPYIPLYGLRHTHATAMIANRENLKTIACRLGTSVQMICETYGHVLKKMEAETVDRLPPIGFSEPSSAPSQRDAA